MVIRQQYKKGSTWRGLEQPLRGGLMSLSDDATSLRLLGALLRMLLQGLPPPPPPLKVATMLLSAKSPPKACCCGLEATGWKALPLPLAVVLPLLMPLLGSSRSARPPQNAKLSSLEAALSPLLPLDP